MLKFNRSDKNYAYLSINLQKRLLGGYVMRYHSTPEVGSGQSVGEHTWRACVILQTLWPDTSHEALLHMLYHDVAEAEFGDLPSPVKLKYAGLAKEYSNVEKEYEKELGVHFSLNKKEAERCKMADMLESILHCAQQLLLGNRLVLYVYTEGLKYMYDTFQTNEDFQPVQCVLEDVQTAIKQHYNPQQVL